MVLFANYKTIVMTTDTGKKKAQGGERVMYTNHRPAWDAKNRHGLPDQLPFTFESVAHIFNAPAPVPEQPAPQPAPQPEPQPQPTPEPQKQNINEQLQEVAQEVAQEMGRAPQAGLLPQALVDLMAPNNVTENELQEVAYIRGHFPMGTPIENFPANYWDMIVANWDATLDVIQNQVRKDPELPFNTNNL